MISSNSAEHTDTGTAKVALVTGATSGLGRAVALDLARAGLDVAALGRTGVDLDDLESELADLGVRSLRCEVDLADTTALSDVVDRVAAQLGRLDVLVNAAATDAPGPAEQLELPEWDRVLAVNLTAPFALARAAMPHMRRAGGGLIVNVSSVAGRRGWAGASAYCSSKFALTGLTQSLAAEGRDDGIRACVLYPGAMQTHWGTFDPAEPREQLPPVDERDSLDPETVAGLITWMATAPGQPVLNEATVTPLREAGWP